MALRKGVELIVGLSHRLNDLAGHVRLRLVGDRAMFSDYRPLLRDLNPAVATYEGASSQADLANLYRRVDTLIQPSHYEPFALTVGGALASGLPVIASDQVGAAERVDRHPCRVFPHESLGALDAATRTLLKEIQAGGADALRAKARAEAQRLFAPWVVTSQLRDVFHLVARRDRVRSQT
jgi:glycosyltransferase involved in cell wall biosynthesis